MRAFYAEFAPTADTRILDVGGTIYNWRLSPCDATIVLLNLKHANPVSTERITSEVGDARDLPYGDCAFDIVFSNSLIEHLHTFPDQLRCASEIRRAGVGLWVQTPARSFPVEPHFIAPLVHYLPRSWQRRLLRHFTLWGLIAKPSSDDVDSILDEIRLLTCREMRTLFPDCEIRRERFLGLTKAYVAVRHPANVLEVARE